jgi:hypothetical protein
VNGQRLKEYYWGLRRIPSTERPPADTPSPVVELTGSRSSKRCLFRVPLPEGDDSSHEAWVDQSDYPALAIVEVTTFGRTTRYTSHLPNEFANNAKVSTEGMLFTVFHPGRTFLSSNNTHPLCFHTAKQKTLYVTIDPPNTPAVSCTSWNSHGSAIALPRPAVSGKITVPCNTFRHGSNYLCTVQIPRSRVCRLKRTRCPPPQTVVGSPHSAKRTLARSTHSSHFVHCTQLSRICHRCLQGITRFRQCS